MGRRSSSRIKRDGLLNEADRLFDDNEAGFGIDVQSRKDIMSLLSKREKDGAELESCYSELKEKTGGRDFEEMAKESFKELKEMKEMQELYKL